MALAADGRRARPRPCPARLAWALWTLTVLGLVATAWLDRLLRQASAPELTALPASGIPTVAAAASAVTVGAVLASRRPRHPVGWLLAAVVHPQPLYPEYPEVGNPLAVLGLSQGLLEVVAPAAGVVVLVSLVVAAVSLLGRFRRARGTERQQLR
jgi:hypothetical protein